MTGIATEAVAGMATMAIALAGQTGPIGPFREPSSSGGFFSGYPVFCHVYRARYPHCVPHFLAVVGRQSQTQSKGQKEDYEITIDNLEEYIHESDLDRFLRERPAKGQYREAIRVYYLTWSAPSLKETHRLAQG